MVWEWQQCLQLPDLLRSQAHQLQPQRFSLVSLSLKCSKSDMTSVLPPVLWAAGGTLASLIPPSAILVIYAIIVEQSVGQLLLAGFLPGMVSALIYGGLVIGLAKIRKDLGPPVTGFTWKERFASLPGAMPIFFVVFIIIFCIYGGWGTPTEAGALGAFVVLVMALWKGMKWADLSNALMESAKLTVMIFTIIWGVLIYVRFLGFANLPEAFADWITNLNQAPILTLLLILCAYAVLGMFMDAIGMLLLTLPVVYPAIIALNGGEGVSAANSSFGMSETECAIWFGIIVVKMAELCLITPPIGLNCFVVAGVRSEYLGTGCVPRRITILYCRCGDNRSFNSIPRYCFVPAETPARTGIITLKPSRSALDSPARVL